MDADLSLHEITSLEDDALPQVLDIYQQSFPLREQMPFSWWIEFLRQKSRGEGEHRHLLTLLEGESAERRVAAFAYYEDEEEGAYLWYLATQPGRRGGGVGARLFQEVARRAFHQGHYLFFEVELPEEAAKFSEEEAAFARRRIAWYQRNGARLLGGIEYIQQVAWQPPYPMGLMLASPDELTSEAAFEIASSLLGDSVRQTGALTLS